jgi:predicted MPP superfamily phosphohydrolase
MGMGKKPTRRQVLKWGTATAFGGLLTEALLEPNRLESIERTAQIRDLPRSFEGFRIGILSDIHWGHAIDLTFVHRASAMLMDLKPDIIVIPGDFYHSIFRHRGEVKPMDGLLDGLNAPFGLFGVLGNHDHRAGAKLVREQIARKSSVQLIDNEHTLITKGSDTIALGGVGDLWEDIVDLSSAFKGVPMEMPRILLSHNPDVAEHVAHDDGTLVDFQISGHTHGGQIVLPGIYDPTQRVSSYGAKFSRGMVQGKRHSVFVSKGIARLNHLRLFAPPDVACIRLVCKT